MSTQLRPQLTLGLYTRDGTEVSAPEYQRVPYSLGNSNYAFPAASSNWGTVVGAFIFDQNGQPLAGMNFAVVHDIVPGTTIQVQIDAPPIPRTL